MKKARQLIAILCLLFLWTQLLSFEANAYSTVQYGSTGEDVKILQTMLNTIDDTGLDVDGIFGQATKTAVLAFQRANNLTVDGIVGQNTWSKLSAIYSKAKTSTLKIGNGNYRPGTLNKGSSYSISGTISSNFTIKTVTVGVYTSSGTATAQVKSVSPNATSYNINGVDNYIKFGALDVGTYYFKVTAKDASGRTKKLVNNKFTIVSPESTLAIGSGSYSPGTIYKGDSYYISGEITSNYKITSVTVGIYTASGNATSQIKTLTPNAKSYNISQANNDILFGTLNVGTYYFKVTAKDASGKSKTLVNNKFAVKAASTLSIGSGSYKPGTINKGDDYTFNGKISSNYKIISVTIGIYTISNVATGQVKTVSPNEKSYEISNANGSINFGALGAGTYYFRVTAKDATGVSKTLVNNKFKVRLSSLKIGSGCYDPKVLVNHQAYSIKAKITSNQIITSVTVGVYKPNGNPTTQVVTVQPNATSYNISSVDEDINFGKLSYGTYYFKVIATDKSGNTLELVNNSFKVVASYSQKNKKWKDVAYYYGVPISGEYDIVGNVGCGPMSLLNCIHYLTNRTVDQATVEDICWYAAPYHTQAGTDHDFFRVFCNNQGSEYGVKYVTKLSKDDFTSLKSYLAQGCVATFGITGHVMAVVAYDTESACYLILDSAPSNSRGTAADTTTGKTAGYAWVDQDWLGSNVIIGYTVIKHS